MFEIYVYSRQLEGIHLRVGRVARGGIRWCDRHDDFRTEILGLMKTQKVKNAIIVPVGSKGGFVPQAGAARHARGDPSRGHRALQRVRPRPARRDGQHVAGDVIHPRARVSCDEDDPYLVVAADKGTATFSDTANACRTQYGFWLGDAFASGGTDGYDHKKIGITARGGWECVKHHFHNLGRDVQSRAFTVRRHRRPGGRRLRQRHAAVRRIRLLAAFNHLHIFVDPAPDPERSYGERERIFNLPAPSWRDYARASFQWVGHLSARCEGHRLESARPCAVRHRRAEVTGDAAGARDPQAGGRPALERRHRHLRQGHARGATPRSATAATTGFAWTAASCAARSSARAATWASPSSGRLEFALAAAGSTPTSSTTRAASICSDHEVNIKIQLDVVRRRTKLTAAARNKLLAEMTDDVGALVLRDNYLQSQAISLLEANAAERLGEHAHFIRALELDGLLDRALEFLPSAEEIEERNRIGRGLTRPELSMVLSYAKIALNNQLIHSDVPEDPYLGRELDRYFPDRLSKRYASLLGEHRLKREIITTATTNSIVNRMGPTFVARTQQDTGADVATVSRAYTIAREVFDIRDVWQSVERLDNKVAAGVQYAMVQDTIALIRQVTYWLIQRHRGDLGIESQVGRLQPGVRALAASQPGWLEGLERAACDARAGELTAAGVPVALARQVAACSALQCAPTSSSSRRVVTCRWIRPRARTSAWERHSGSTGSAVASRLSTSTATGMRSRAAACGRRCMKSIVAWCSGCSTRPGSAMPRARWSAGRRSMARPPCMRRRSLATSAHSRRARTSPRCRSRCRRCGVSSWPR